MIYTNLFIKIDILRNKKGWKQGKKIHNNLKFINNIKFEFRKLIESILDTYRNLKSEFVKIDVVFYYMLYR